MPAGSRCIDDFIGTRSGRSSRVPSLVQAGRWALQRTSARQSLEHRPRRQLPALLYCRPRDTSQAQAAPCMPVRTATSGANPTSTHLSLPMPSSLDEATSNLPRNSVHTLFASAIIAKYSPDSGLEAIQLAPNLGRFPFL